MSQWRTTKGSDGITIYLTDPNNNFVGTLREEMAEFVVAACNTRQKWLEDQQRRDEDDRQRREEERQLKVDGIGGARIGDEVVVRTSKGPYQGVVKYLYPYVGSVHVRVTFKYRERRPVEHHHDFSHGEGLMIKADAILRNITREKEAGPA